MEAKDFQNSESLREVLNRLSDGVVFTDLDSRITFWNRAAERITGIPAELAVLASRSEILTEIEQDEKPEADEDSTVTQDWGFSVYVKHAEGHSVPVNVRAVPLRDAEGRLVGAVEIFTERGGRMASLERVRELEEMAYLDPLTGLGNRRFGERTIRTRLNELWRQGWEFGVVFVDIDDLKVVNDEHGHNAGDELLKMVGRTVSGNLRVFDFACRWGGDEFVAVVANVDKAELLRVAERLRALVARSRTPHGGPGTTVSVGATMARRDDTVGSLVARADRLMYESKNSGRDRVTSD